MPVIDSSPLIYLGKAEKLHLLKELYGSIKLPESVYHEVVVKGEDGGFEDATRIKAEIGKFLFVHQPRKEKVDEVRERSEKLDFQLGKGEVECIALCLETGDKIFLSDDEDAKKFARIYGINGKGTIYLLLKSCKEGFLGKKECTETFEEIIRKGFWVSPEIVELFHKTLERI